MHDGILAQVTHTGSSAIRYTVSLTWRLHWMYGSQTWACCKEREPQQIKKDNVLGCYGKLFCF